MKSKLNKEFLEAMLESGEEESFDDLAQLTDLAQDLAQLDIGVSELAKKKAYKNMMEKSKEMDGKMKNKFKYKKVASLGLVALIGVGMVQTGLAGNIYSKVKSIISLDHVTMVESDFGPNDSQEVPKELKGKIFDENGQELETISSQSKIYNAQGQELDSIDLEDGSKLSIKDSRQESQDYIYMDTVEAANDYLAFKLQVPGFVPEGYSLKHVKLYSEKKDGEYADLVYSKGDKEFIIMERLAKDENGFEASGLAIQEIEINGNRAIIDRKANLDIEIEDTIISLMSMGNLKKDQAIKIIESIR